MELKAKVLNLQQELCLARTMGLPSSHGMPTHPPKPLLANFFQFCSDVLFAAGRYEVIGEELTVSKVHVPENATIGIQIQALKALVLAAAEIFGVIVKLALELEFLCRPGNRFLSGMPEKDVDAGDSTIDGQVSHGDSVGHR